MFVTMQRLVEDISIAMREHSNGNCVFAVELYRRTKPENLFSLCGGGIEYHRSPVSYKRQQKMNPVTESATGPPCFWWI
jgi:hypothetical protein